MTGSVPLSRTKTQESSELTRTPNFVSMVESFPITFSTSRERLVTELADIFFATLTLFRSRPSRRGQCVVCSVMQALFPLRANATAEAAFAAAATCHNGAARSLGGSGARLGKSPSGREFMAVAFVDD